MTTTAPATTDADGATVPDLTGLDGYLAATLDPGGETYTVTMPPEWEDPRQTQLWRLRVVCEVEGLEPAIEAALNAMPGPDGVYARGIWQRGGVIEWDSPLLADLAAAVGLSDAEVDGLFAAARAIPV